MACVAGGIVGVFNTKLEYSPRILFCFRGSDKELRLPVQGQRGTEPHVGVMQNKFKFMGTIN